MWILIVIMAVGYGGRDFVAFQEFTTKAKCESAKIAIKENSDYIGAAFCKEK